MTFLPYLAGNPTDFTDATSCVYPELDGLGRQWKMIAYCTISQALRGN